MYTRAPYVPADGIQERRHTLLRSARLHRARVFAHVGPLEILDPQVTVRQNGEPRVLGHADSVAPVVQPILIRRRLALNSARQNHRGILVSESPRRVQDDGGPALAVAFLGPGRCWTQEDTLRRDQTGSDGRRCAGFTSKLYVVSLTVDQQ